MLVHRKVTPSIKLSGTQLYTWVKRGTMRVKCFAQEHNSVPRPGLEPGRLDPESSAVTIRPRGLPQWPFVWAILTCATTLPRAIFTLILLLGRFYVLEARVIFSNWLLFRQRTKTAQQHIFKATKKKKIQFFVFLFSCSHYLERMKKKFPQSY